MSLGYNGLFIDRSKASLRCALQHNGNYFAPILIDHFVQLKETYKNVKIVLERLNHIL